MCEEQSGGKSYEEKKGTVIGKSLPIPVGHNWHDSTEGTGADSTMTGDVFLSFALSINFFIASTTHLDSQVHCTTSLPKTCSVWCGEGRRCCCLPFFFWLSCCLVCVCCVLARPASERAFFLARFLFFFAPDLPVRLSPKR